MHSYSFPSPSFCQLMGCGMFPPVCNVPPSHWLMDRDVEGWALCPLPHQLIGMFHPHWHLRTFISWQGKEERHTSTKNSHKFLLLLPAGHRNILSFPLTGWAGQFGGRWESCDILVYARRGSCAGVQWTVKPNIDFAPILCSKTHFTTIENSIPETCRYIGLSNKSDWIQWGLLPSCNA